MPAASFARRSGRDSVSPDKKLPVGLHKASLCARAVSFFLVAKRKGKKERKRKRRREKIIERNRGTWVEQSSGLKKKEGGE